MWRTVMRDPIPRRDRPRPDRPAKASEKGPPRNQWPASDQSL